MNPRHLLLSALAAFIVCSPSPAAPPEGKPVLVPLWKKTTVGLAKEDDAYKHEEFQPGQEWTAKQYSDLIVARKAADKHMIAPSMPVGIGDTVVSPNDRGIGVFALSPTKQGTHAVKAGEVYWHIDRLRSLVFVTCDLGGRSFVERMRDSHPTELRSEYLIHNSLSRSLLMDDKYVHFVDELAILPAALSDQLPGNSWFDSGVTRNHIYSIEVGSGRYWAKLPGRGESFADEKPIPTKVLCAPLAQDKIWLFVSETDKRLHLTSRPWERDSQILQGDLRDPKAINWETELVESPLPLIKEPHRRIHAIHLVQAGDLILCPTHLGRVVAVESKTGKIKWTHEYAPLDAKRFPTFAPEWVVVPPVVVGDKYIYAPADFPELLCLNVADGKKVWSVKKGDGLYPAVVGEQVLVVGEKTLRSLNLKDGSEQWKLDLPGLPCGRGAMLGDKYLLPVSEPKTWRGMIAMIDVKAGKITEVLKPDRDEPIGNLVVHQEFLISQTLTEIAVFPIRK